MPARVQQMAGPPGKPAARPLIPIPIAMIRSALPIHDTCLRPQQSSRVKSLPATPAPRVSAPVVPRLIGSIAGVALPLGEVCLVAANDGECSERFAINAFQSSIARGGTTIQLNHATVPISGEVQLFIDASRLLFRLRVFDTPLGRDAIAKVNGGALRGASIGFIPIRERRDGLVREIAEADLRETAP